jgi:signal peptidase
MIFMVCLVMIVSNKFRFGSIVIATPSMEGEINVGDMIIYERIDSDDVVSVGQVIVYEKDDIIIVHRVDEVEYIDGVLRYYTKGDANENRDSGYITRDNIIGITDFKVAYVGYPTLWLLELFEND